MGRSYFNLKLEGDFVYRGRNVTKIHKLKDVWWCRSPSLRENIFGVKLSCFSGTAKDNFSSYDIVHSMTLMPDAATQAVRHSSKL